MRVGKATVVLSLMCWLIQGIAVVAQQDSTFEALLSDIGPETDAAPAEVSPAAAPSVEEMPAVEVAPAAEPMIDTTPAEAPVEDMLAVPVIEEAPVEAPAAEVEPAMAEEMAPMEPEPAEASAEMPAEMMPAEEAPAMEAPVEAAAFEEAPAEPAPEEAMPAEEPVFEAPAEMMPAEAAAEVMPEEAPAEMMPAEAMPAEEPAEAAAEMMREEAEPAMAEEAAPEEAAAQPPGGKPAKKAFSAKEAKALAAQEEVRRQEMEIKGFKSLEAGYRALAAGDFEGAVKGFDEALVNIPERPANVDARERARWGLAEAHYRIAWDIFRKGGDLLDAKQQNGMALRLVPEHRPALSLQQKIARMEAAPPPPMRKQPSVVERKTKIQGWIDEGRQYYEIKDYASAEVLFEKVLLEDPYNTDAMRFLKKIEEDKYRIRSKERSATAAKMMTRVRETWNPPIREEVELPEAVRRRGPVTTVTGAQRLQEKMGKIMIPSIEFRAANIVDVVNFLVEASIAGDPDGNGVNIILNLTIPGGESSAQSMAPTMPAVDEFGPMFEPAPEAAPLPAPGGASSIRTITLNLRRISLLDAIKYITEVANLKYRLEDNAVIITPAGVVSGRVITRLYPVQPSILEVIVQKEETDTSERTGEFIEMGGARTTIKRGDVKEFFEKAGVPFPVGTSITYNQTISQLIVANTPENLEIFDRILSQLNVVPSQIEIEARFVEVGENDLEELGLQWTLTDNYEFAMRKDGLSPLAGKERLQVEADADGFTKGLRFFAFDRATASVDPASAVTRGINQSSLGGIMTIASVLTNPELKVVLQALAQKGNADLLSAPRVTTTTGVNAQIKVVREIIYPTEFEVTQPQMGSSSATASGTGAIGASAILTPPTVTPGSFETRETGVILNVTPTVGPDGYTITLTVVPEVAELVDWIQYGSAMSVAGVNFVYNIPQPVFSSRNATTSIVIWDGQTVVMGGLIREELVTISDKIPFLGDIPILGRLFRTEGQKSRKTNLLIFVTARLVDPAGKPIHKAEAMAMPGGAATMQPNEPVAP